MRQRCAARQPQAVAHTARHWRARTPTCPIPHWNGERAARSINLNETDEAVSMRFGPAYTAAGEQGTRDVYAYGRTSRFAPEKFSCCTFSVRRALNTSFYSLCMNLGVPQNATPNLSRPVSSGHDLCVNFRAHESANKTREMREVLWERKPVFYWWQKRGGLGTRNSALEKPNHPSFTR